MSVGSGIEWRERSFRDGWDVRYTTIGARVTDPERSEPCDVAADAQRDCSELLTSQVLVALGGGVRLDQEPTAEPVARWGAAVRRILQRGKNPPAAPRLSDFVGATTASPHAVISLFASETRLRSLDPSIELHPTWEVPFWEIVSTRYPSLAPWIVPQVSLEGLLGRPRDDGEQRWVDFVFHPPWRPRPVVLEIDGSGHERSGAVDAGRDEELARAGIPVYRIAGVDVTKPDAEHWAAFDKAARESGELGSTTADPLVLAPTLIHRFAFALSLLAERGTLGDASEDWSVRVIAPDSAIAATGWVLDFLLSVDQSLLTGVMPPVIHVNDSKWVLDGEQYARTSTGPTIESRATIVIEHFASGHEELPTTEHPTAVLRSVFLPRRATWWPEHSGKRWNLPDGDQKLVRRGIERLAHDLFGYPELRAGQFDAILRVLQGGDSVVLLPTGSGKSLIYQLAGLLRPGLCLVVDPIRALIDDQERRLLAAGIDRVAPIHGQRAGGRNAREAIQARIASGDALFAFVTPERLLDRGFREAISQAALENTINLAVIDEAHCVSEWGHSFRTAFLRLGTNLRRFGRDARGEPPPLLALTGTASPAVLADTLRELEIDGSEPGALQRPTSFDRRNLRYIMLAGAAGERNALLREALLERVPTAAGLNAQDLRSASGIVFVPHASGDRGVQSSQAALRKALDLAAEEPIGIYAGGVPESGKRPNRRPIMDIQAWEELKRTTAADFVEGRLPLLVATKAFGMGIDKPDIRFTVHLGYPASIESFAQEAGRAGRDGLPSACVIVGTLPTEAEVEEVLPRTLGRPSSGARTKPSWENDFGVQLRLINRSYLSRDQETKDAQDLFDDLRRRGAKGGGYLNLPSEIQLSTRKLSIQNRGSDGDSGEGVSSQKLLFRLSIVGVVDDIEFVGGGVLRVHFGNFEEPADASGSYVIDRATLAFLQRNDPGRLRQHEARIAGAPHAIDARVRHHLSVAIGAIYDVIYPARVRALEAMHRLVADELDDGAARARIVAYLHEGPMATNLQTIVESETVEVSRAISLFDASPPSNDYEWQGAADRMLESYPRHPLVLAVRAIGETWSPQGDPRRFGEYLLRLFDYLPEFALTEEDTGLLVSWLLRQVRNHPRHDRRSWLEWAWAAISTRDISQTSGIQDLLELVLKNAENGNYVTEEINSVLAITTDQVVPALT